MPLLCSTTEKSWQRAGLKKLEGTGRCKRSIYEGQNKMLRLEAIEAYYGASRALRGVSLEVREGEVVGLLGRNGTGKTTTLKSILGLVKVKGKIWFNNREITKLPAYKRSRIGIGYVPQGARVFPKMTVRENLLLASPKDERALARSFEYFPALYGRLAQRAGTLSGGEQQMLAIARALIAGPKLLLLDEPTEGLMPSLVAVVEETIKSISRSGISILLAEQNLGLVGKVCKHIYIMEKGAIVWGGEVKELNKSELQKYLGVGL